MSMLFDDLAQVVGSVLAFSAAAVVALLRVAVSKFFKIIICG